MSSDPFFDHLMGVALNVFDAYSAVLFLPDGEGDACRPAASLSLGDEVRQDARIAPGMGIVGWIIRNKSPLLISNFDQKRGRLGYYDEKTESRIRAFMGAPLDGVAGAVCLDSKKTFTFGEKDQKILGQFAALLGARFNERRALEKDLREHAYYQCLQIIAGLRAKHPRWAAFRDSLLSLLSEITDYGLCFLAVRDESGRRYYLEGSNRDPYEGAGPPPAQYSMGQGAVGWVFKNSAPVCCGEREAARAPLFGKDDPAGNFKNVICEPLIYSRLTRAVLVFADDKADPPSDELKTFIRLVCDNLTLFLENLHLKSRLSKPRP